MRAWRKGFLSTLNNLCLKTTTNSFEKDGQPTSLFDRNAYIDYGRNIDEVKWDEYKKDDIADYH